MFKDAFHDLFFADGTGHSLMVLAFVIGIGLMLGKIDIKGIPLGAVWILLVGIAAGALGVKASPLFLHFAKEMGLVLFVFAFGLQVGPSFFHSFKGEGLKLNLMAALLIGLTLGGALLLYSITGEDLPNLAGVMTGASSSTPGLGTAQQALYEVTEGTFRAEIDHPEKGAGIANAFAVAYPIGIVVLMLVLYGFRYIFRVNLGNECKVTEDPNAVVEMLAQVANPAVEGLALSEAGKRFEVDFVPMTVNRAGKIIPAADDPALKEGDIVTLEAKKSDHASIIMLFGREAQKASQKEVQVSGNMVSRRLTVTKPGLTGKKLGDLDILGKYSVTITRVIRSGVSLVARPDLALQMGDVLKAVGEEKTMDEVAKLVGNSSVSLEKPNLVPIFIGLGLGIVLGTIPFKVPGMSHAMRLGLAGGPLIVSILLGHFGPKMKIATYATSSAKRMLREMGLALLMGSIGLSAGASFLHDFDPAWIWYAAFLAGVPAIIIGLVARYILKLNFFQICGLIIGANTNSTVLSFSEKAFGSDRAADSFATVYPLSLFLQVLIAQLVVLLYFV